MKGMRGKGIVECGNCGTRIDTDVEGEEEARCGCGHTPVQPPLPVQLLVDEAYRMMQELKRRYGS